MKLTTQIMDIKNNYPPFWELSGLNKYSLLGIYIFIISFWSLVYYNKLLQFKSASFMGALSAFLFTKLYDFIYQTEYAYMINNKTNEWIKMKGDIYDQILDLSKVDTAIQVDPAQYGFIVTNEYFDKLKKKTHVFSVFERFIERKFETNKSTTNYLSTLLNFRLEQLPYQGYCLIIILFTILSVIYNNNKALFKKVFPLFLYAVSLSVPFIFIWFWFYSNNDMLMATNVKTHFLFLAASITIGILVEVLQIYN